LKRFGTSLLNVVQKSEKEVEANQKTKNFLKEVSLSDLMFSRFKKIKG